MMVRSWSKAALQATNHPDNGARLAARRVTITIVRSYRQALSS